MSTGRALPQGATRKMRCGPRSAQTQRNASPAVASLNEPYEVEQEQIALRLGQVVQRAIMRPLHRRPHPGNERTTLGREPDQFGAGIVRALLALEESARFEARNDLGNARALEADFERQRHLVDLAVLDERGHQTVLDRGDVERLGLLEEQGGVDLMQPADEKAGPSPERRALDRGGNMRRRGPSVRA